MQEILHVKGQSELKLQKKEEADNIVTPDERKKYLGLRDWYCKVNIITRRIRSELSNE